MVMASQHRHIRDAGLLWLAALLLPLGACFADPGRHGQSDTGSTGTGDTGATTRATTPTTGDAGTSGTSSADLTTTTTGASESGDLTGTPTTVPTTDPTTDPTADPTGKTTDPSTTAPTPAVCGNGIVEGNEGCDHGPENGGAYCNADCTAPACNDFIQNQEESDVDCGGPCLTCGLCQTCNTDADCNGNCIGGRCTRTDVLNIKYLENCGDTTDPWVTGPVVSGGSYTVAAEDGGGSVTGNDKEYGWLAECVGLNLQQMSTGFVYFSPQEAFAALNPKQLQLDFAGGGLRCGLIDPDCSDNIGGVSLSFTIQCSP